MTIRSTKRRSRFRKNGGKRGDHAEPLTLGDAARRRIANSRRRANETALDAVIRYLGTDEGSLNGTLLLLVVVSLIISSFVSPFLRRGGSRRTQKSRTPSSSRHSRKTALLNLKVNQLLANVNGETKCRNHINNIENIISSESKIGTMTVKEIIAKFDRESTEKEKDELFDNLVEEYNKCAK